MRLSVIIRVDKRMRIRFWKKKKYNKPSDYSRYYDGVRNRFYIGD